MKNTYELLSYTWNQIYFILIRYTKREFAIKESNSILFYFLMADKDKNTFTIAISKFLKRAKIKIDIRDEILLEYRNFYKEKIYLEKLGFKIGTSRQVKLLKIESEIFKKRELPLCNEEFLKLYENEIDDYLEF